MTGLSSPPDLSEVFPERKESGQLLYSTIRQPPALQPELTIKNRLIILIKVQLI